MEKLKIVVLGDGLLGTELSNRLKSESFSRKKNNFDVLYFDEWCENLANYNIIINCIANTNTYSNDRKLHWDVNYKFVHHLIEYCNKYEKKLIHISTDYVYSFSDENAGEDDVPVHNKSWYGYTKLLSDGLIQLLSNNYLICRCTHKMNPFPYEEAWIDQIGNFDYVDEITNLIIQLIETDAKGVYNVGTQLKTMFELANKTKKVKKIFSPTHVPKNTSMNIDKLKKQITKI